MFGFTEEQLALAPYNLKLIPSELSFSISGRSYYKYPRENTGLPKYENTCVCIFNDGL